jgi:hypothetical protein
LSGVTVNGKCIDIGTAQENLAVIDTDMPFIGAPSKAVNAIWSSVPGARPLMSTKSPSQPTGWWNLCKFFLVFHAPFSLGVCPNANLKEFWMEDLIPLYHHTACNTTLNISISFGGPLWPISDIDVVYDPSLDDGLCVGNIFDAQLTIGSTRPGAPLWTIGTTFLVRFIGQRPHLTRPDMAARPFFFSQTTVEKRVHRLSCQAARSRLCTTLGSSCQWSCIRFAAFFPLLTWLTSWSGLCLISHPTRLHPHRGLGMIARSSYSL